MEDNKTPGDADDMSALEPSGAAAAGALTTPASAASGLLLPGQHAVAVGAGGGTQLELGVEAGRPGPRHEREEFRAELAGRARTGCAASPPMIRRR